MQSEYSVCVVDNIGGIYLNVALKMSEYFSKVYYHCVVQNPFPMLSSCKVGTGFDQIEIIKDFWSNLDNFDIIIFPDIYFSQYTPLLKSLGKLIWGGYKAEELELDRKLFNIELENAGMNVVNTNYITGLDNLISYLKDKEDKWLKISYYRGNFETFHHINMNQSMVMLNNLKLTMGPLANDVEFLVCDNLDSVAEVGYDGYCVNGMFPQNQIVGIEIKDLGYVSTNMNIENVWPPVREINGMFAPVLQKYQPTGFYSNEIRVGKDGLNYYTDPCMRCGAPSSGVYLDMITNWDQIIIGGCQGNMVEPKYSGKYGVELILKSTYCNNNFMPITIPDEYKQYVKLKGAFIQDGQYYIIPFIQCGINDMEAFASVVIIGDNFDEILNKAIEVADSIECYGLTYDKDALNRAKQSASDVTKLYNIEF